MREKEWCAQMGELARVAMEETRKFTAGLQTAAEAAVEAESSNSRLNYRPPRPATGAPMSVHAVGAQVSVQAPTGSMPLA